MVFEDFADSLCAIQPSISNPDLDYHIQPISSDDYEDDDSYEDRKRYGKRSDKKQNSSKKHKIRKVYDSYADDDEYYSRQQLEEQSLKKARKLILQQQKLQKQQQLQQLQSQHRQLLQHHQSLQRLPSFQPHPSLQPLHNGDKSKDTDTMQKKRSVLHRAYSHHEDIESPRSEHKMTGPQSNIKVISCPEMVSPIVEPEKRGRRVTFWLSLCLILLLILIAAMAGGIVGALYWGQNANDTSEAIEVIYNNNNSTSATIDAELKNADLGAIVEATSNSYTADSLTKLDAIVEGMNASASILPAAESEPDVDDIPIVAIHFDTQPPVPEPEEAQSTVPKVPIIGIKPPSTATNYALAPTAGPTSMSTQLASVQAKNMTETSTPTQISSTRPNASPTVTPRVSFNKNLTVAHIIHPTVSPTVTQTTLLPTQLLTQSPTQLQTQSPTQTPTQLSTTQNPTVQQPTSTPTEGSNRERRTSLPTLSSM